MSSLNFSIKIKTQQKVCKMADVITETDVITKKNDDQEWYHLFKNSQPNMLFVLYRINNTSDAYIEKHWFLNPKCLIFKKDGDIIELRPDKDLPYHLLM